MAVLIEGISVVVRRDSISQTYVGGWGAFIHAAPNVTLCYDEEVARIGLMVPADVERFVRGLERRGLTFLDNGTAQDFVVVDQQRGPTTPCDWLEFALVPFHEAGASGTVAMCWFFDGPRVAHGLHSRSNHFALSTPAGWKFEGSLSHRYTFVPAGEEGDRVALLRVDDSVEVYLDRATGKELYVARMRK